MIALTGSNKGRMVIRVIWIVFIIIGAFSDLGLVWDLADTANGLIIIPNVIALFVLTKEVIDFKDHYYDHAMPEYLEAKARKAAK